MALTVLDLLRAAAAKASAPQTAQPARAPAAPVQTAPPVRPAAPAAVRRPVPPTPARVTPRAGILAAFSDGPSLARAVVVAELLAPPVALRS